MTRLPVTVAAVVLYVTAGGPVAAEEASQPGPAPSVVAEAWAWRLQETATPSLAPASGIRDGQLPVAWFGQDDKLSYLSVAPPPDADGRLSLTVAVDDSEVNLNVEQADLIACVVNATVPAESPVPWQEQPERNCDTSARGVYQPATTDFYFDLGPLVPDLAAPGATGIVIAPDPTTDVAAFQVVFRSAVSGGAQLRYEAAVAPGTEATESAGALPATGSPSIALPRSSPQVATPLRPEAAGTAPSVVPPAAAGSAPGPAVTDTAAGPPLPVDSRRASFASFYNGMAALALLLAARPIAPAVVALFRQGAAAQHTSRRSRPTTGARS